MTESTPPTHEADPDSEPEDAAPARASLFRLILGVLLAVAVLVASGVLVVLLTQRSGAAQDEQQAREVVMAQAEKFMVRINTYGPDLLEGEQMPKYREQVDAVITPKFGTDFEKNVPAAEATVAQAGLARTAEVLGTGVSTIDEDSATALVAGSFTNSYPESEGSDQRVDATPSPFRVQVSLVKTQGKWLVDDFSPLTGLDDDAQQQPGEAPSIDTSLFPSGVPSTDVSELPSLAPSTELPTGAPSAEPSSEATP